MGGVLTGSLFAGFSIFFVTVTLEARIFVAAGVGFFCAKVIRANQFQWGYRLIRIP